MLKRMQWNHWGVSEVVLSDGSKVARCNLEGKYSVRRVRVTSNTPLTRRERENVMRAAASCASHVSFFWPHFSLLRSRRCR